jgi:F-type H+-transporting ATPase subunit epsilon
MLKLEIVTPERRVVDETVDSVTIPTLSGEAGILPQHAPLISALKPGILSYTIKGNTESLAIGGGFAEVNSDKISVLASLAETPLEVNLEQARAEREEAEKALASSANSPIGETEDLRDRIDFANARLQLAGR